MKQVTFSPVVTLLTWALVGVTAFAVGYFAGDRSGATDSRSRVAAPTAEIESRPNKHDDGHDERVPSAAVPTLFTNDEARAHTFEILAVPNRLERTRQLCELLTHINR